MAQKDPLVEYRGEGHKMFEELGGIIREEVVVMLFHAQIEVQGDGADGNGAAPLEPQGPNGNLQYAHETAAGADVIAAAGAGIGTATALAPPRAETAQGTVVNDETKEVGRNDPCWCGSGKKFKKCHGA
jgi:preprotein translocase subunit SecA